MDHIYFDYNSTVPLSEDHLEKVMAVLKSKDGNPSNTHHVGRAAKSELEKTRKLMARAIGVSPKEVSFNSGATEGNNQVIRGFAKAEENSNPVVIISEGAHSSIYNTAVSLQSENKVELVKLPLENSGVIDSNELKKSLSTIATERPVLLSILYANNETGIKNDIDVIADIVNSSAQNVMFHVDAVQALGKISLDELQALGNKVHAATFSGHKVGAFKGVGALYVRSGVNLPAMITGGGQEKKFRSGTENLPGIVSFGIKLHEILEGFEGSVFNTEVVSAMYDGLTSVSGLELHGDYSKSNKVTFNFHIPEVNIEMLNLRLDMAGIAVSNGSACSSGVPTPSRVLLAMGLDEWSASNSLRVSLGPQSTLSEVERFLSTLKSILGREK